MSEAEQQQTSQEKALKIEWDIPDNEACSVQMVDSIEDEEADEREWDAIVSKPHVREALRRLARETRRQIAAGEDALF